MGATTTAGAAPAPGAASDRSLKRSTACAGARVAREGRGVGRRAAAGRFARVRGGRLDATPRRAPRAARRARLCQPQPVPAAARAERRAARERDARGLEQVLHRPARLRGWGGGGGGGGVMGRARRRGACGRAEARGRAALLPTRPPLPGPAPALRPPPRPPPPHLRVVVQRQVHHRAAACRLRQPRLHADAARRRRRAPRRLAPRGADALRRRRARAGRLGCRAGRPRRGGGQANARGPRPRAPAPEQTTLNTQQTNKQGTSSNPHLHQQRVQLPRHLGLRLARHAPLRR